jgi:hypothetical protein
MVQWLMCHQKTRGILSAMCTSPLLDIHGLKYVPETFIEVWQFWFKYSPSSRS